MRKVSSRKVRAGIHIREVEKRLFSYLFVNKVATSLQIARDVYRGVSHQALYKRLNKLIASGYLAANYHRELRGRLIYSLSPRAFHGFVKDGASSELRKQLKSDSVLHDLDLLDIKKKLKGLDSVAQYYAENVLRSGSDLPDEDGLRAFRGHRFDAVLKIRRQSGDKLWALEYERSCKFSARYVSYFKRLYANCGVTAVLFVCRDGSTQKRITQLERSVLADNWPKVFYVLLPDVLQAEGFVTFENLNKEKITLK